MKEEEDVKEGMVREDEGVKVDPGWTLKVFLLTLISGICLRMVQSPGSFWRQKLLFFSSQVRKEAKVSRLAGCSCLRIVTRSGWRREGGALRGFR